MTHKRRRSNISTIGDEKRPSTCSPWGRDRWPVGLFFFEDLAFESHQFIKTTGCISKMSPVAAKNSLFEKSCFSNFLNWKVAINIWKHRTFVRCFLCCIFHQHILVRVARFELTASWSRKFGTGSWSITSSLICSQQSPCVFKGLSAFLFENP